MNGMQHLKWMAGAGIGVLAVALAFGATVQGALYLAVVLACPLMMVLMMSSHGGGHGGDTHERDGTQAPHEDTQHKI